MDNIVLRAMAKWPNVPAVYGWLALDRRGRWLIKGQPITHPAVCAFIGRNYEQDADGAWFFQNGPQRVFATLEYTPFVYRVLGAENAAVNLSCHTGHLVCEITAAWLDDDGSLLLESEYGIGLLDDRDLDRLLQCFRDSRGAPAADEVLERFMEPSADRSAIPLRLDLYGKVLDLRRIESAKVPQQFRFVKDPRAP